MKSVPAAPFRSRRRRYPTRTCASSGNISRFFLTNYYPSPATVLEWNHRGSPHIGYLLSTFPSVSFSSLRSFYSLGEECGFLLAKSNFYEREKWKETERFRYFACHFSKFVYRSFNYYNSWLTSLIIYGNIEF